MLDTNQLCQKFFLGSSYKNVTIRLPTYFRYLNEFNQVGSRYSTNSKLVRGRIGKTVTIGIFETQIYIILVVDGCVHRGQIKTLYENKCSRLSKILMLNYKQRYQVHICKCTFLVASPEPLKPLPSIYRTSTEPLPNHYRTSTE